MIFVTHTTFDDATIKDNYGAPQYSYHFVMKAFEPVLDRLGRRERVTAPQREVDAIFAGARARGEPCLFLSFSPPQLTPLGLDCPTAPVFAWEYENIPDESWTGDPRQDWRHVFARTDMAFTLCGSAADAVRASMGRDYPIWVTPAPVFDRFALSRTEARGWRAPFDLALDGALALDTRDFDLGPFAPARPAGNAERALQMVRIAADRRDTGRPLRLEGAIYTSVLCPRDGRKNWEDMVAGFVWAFRDTPTATLVLKLTQAGLEDAVGPILRLLGALGRFDCRVVLVHGLLSDSAYADLIDATSYAVNTSVGEGQCMPLVEYMSCGRPAVAPDHTAMADYITPENAFVLPSGMRSAVWPHDDRGVQRSRNRQISFDALVRAYRASWRVAQEPARYGRMSDAAVESVRAFCAEDVVAARLTQALAWATRSAAASPRA